MINTVVLVGNVVKDPESRHTPSGKSVSKLRLAVNNPLNDKEVLFIDVESWDKQSEFVSKYIKKGSSIGVVGRLKLDEWTKDGEKQSKYLIISDRIHFVGGNKRKEEEPIVVKDTEQSSPADDAEFAAKMGI